ncbi:ABC transporter permease [Cohnella cholangitidis]|uniref:ABC transporter permease n=1 Tax=Cohnella cholangitidis TaxID=2598458 RepID=A0A7G5BX32_9BACL|nr:ABC transporter permease [Cohnella cholangitidis]QMV41516.1 ABC transporter permease [Cohnella cholangitidis]
MKSSRMVVLEVSGILMAVITALLCGFVVIFLTSSEPFAAVSALFLDPLSSWFNIGTILNKAVPLILTGLALSVVFQTGVFSMGAEGQLYIGSFLGALTAVYLPGLSPWIHLPLVVIAALIGGALFGAIPGLLKAYLNANEIVTTLMLNFVAILLTSYFVNNQFKSQGGGYAKMENIDKNILLAKIIPGTSAHAGILIALAAVAVVYLLLYKTSIGYELRMVGKNGHFARYGGIATRKIIVISVMISGALAGLAGIVEILGIQQTFKQNFSAGLGFDGIIIALLARNHPVGVLVAGLFYAYIQVGAQTMQYGSDMPREVAVIIQVMLVLLVTAQAIFTFIKQRYAKTEQKAVK